MTEEAPATAPETGDTPPVATDNAPDATAAPEATPKTEPAADWRESIPQELRADPSIAKFMTAKDAAEYMAMVSKSYVNASAMIGRDKVPIPKTDEDWSAWYKAAGRPDEPTGYEFKQPDGIPEGFYDPASADVFKAKAHETGLNVKQATSMHDWYVSMMAEAKMEQDAELAKGMTQAEQALRKEWGAAFDSKLNAANAVAAEIGGEDFSAYLVESKLGNDPRMIKAMAKVAEITKGDAALVGTGGDAVQTPAQLEAELTMHWESNKDALMDKFHPAHKAKVAERMAMFNKLHPEKKTG